MNKAGHLITLRIGDIEKLFDTYVDGGHDTDEYRAIQIEIFADEFGTHAQLKEYPEDGCVSLFVRGMDK